MLTRREVLVGGIGAAIFLSRMVRAKASQPATPVNFDVPAGACDCHTHILGDPGEVPVVCRPRLYAGAGAAGGDGGAAQGAAHAARGDRDAERLRHRQLSTLYGMKARGAMPAASR